MSLEVVILAAGQGTRMQSSLPKVLHPVAGKPMLQHVIDSAQTLAPVACHVVVGFGGAQVREQLDIVAVAAECRASVEDVTATHFAVADRLDLTWIRDQILALPRDTQWSTLARLTLRIDLYADHRDLTRLVMAADEGSADARERVDNWMKEHPTAVNRYRQTLVEIRSTSTDLTVLLVAAREVRNLIGRTSTTL